MRHAALDKEPTKVEMLTGTCDTYDVVLPDSTFLFRVKHIQTPIPPVVQIKNKQSGGHAKNPLSILEPQPFPSTGTAGTALAFHTYMKYL